MKKFSFTAMLFMFMTSLMICTSCNSDSGDSDDDENTRYGVMDLKFTVSKDIYKNALLLISYTNDKGILVKDTINKTLPNGDPSDYQWEYSRIPYKNFPAMAGYKLSIVKKNAEKLDSTQTYRLELTRDAKYSIFDYKNGNGINSKQSSRSIKYSNVTSANFESTLSKFDYEESYTIDESKITKVK